MEFEVIQPQIFAGESLHAFFTLKNNQLRGSDQNISGLNLGFNTTEAPEIITKNRHHLLEAFQIDSNWVGFANQVHSNRVKTISQGGTFTETDALVTQIPGLALAIQVADCAAVLIADSQSTTIAAIHAGWRGAAGDIVPRTLERMYQLGAKKGDCKAFISPCISLDNFEVGPEVTEQFPDKFIEYERYTKPHLNLKGFLACQLQQNGFRSSDIEIHPGCTVADEQFYSYRREGAQSGRMMGIIQIREAQI